MTLANPAFEALRPYSTAMPPSAERPAEVRLASNENPYGASPLAIRAMSDAMQGLHRYPDPGASLLRAKLADHTGFGTDHIIMGNGANELLEMIAHTFLAPGENTVYGSPSFIVYKLAPLAMGAEVREVPFLDDCYDLDAMLAAVDERTKLIFLANPNNPTGTCIRKAELDAFIDRLPAHVVLVLDEAYLEFAVADDIPHGLDYFDRHERLIVIKTFSKAYGLAGLRVGYAVAPPELIELMNRGRQPFNVNSLAQVAACAALDDVFHLAHSCRASRDQLLRMGDELHALGCRVVPSQANFLLVDVGRPVGPVLAELARSGVVVRGMAPYGLGTSFRVSAGTHSETDAFLDAIRHVLTGVAERSVA